VQLLRNVLAIENATRKLLPWNLWFNVRRGTLHSVSASCVQKATRERCRNVRRKVKVDRSSSVAIDDADNDDDCHTREGTDGEDQPAIRELPRDHVTQEDGTRMYGLVVGCGVGGCGRALADGWSGAGGHSSTIHRQVGRATNRLGSSVV